MLSGEPFYGLANEETSSRDSRRQESHQLVFCWIVVAIVHVYVLCRDTSVATNPAFGQKALTAVRSKLRPEQRSEQLQTPTLGTALKGWLCLKIDTFRDRRGQTLCYIVSAVSAKVIIIHISKRLVLNKLEETLFKLTSIKTIGRKADFRIMPIVDSFS